MERDSNITGLNNSFLFSGRGQGKSLGRSHNTILTGSSAYDDEILRAFRELDRHLEMKEVHEDEIGSYLEDNPEMTEKLGILIAAGAVPLHEMSQVEYQEFRAYAMGDVVVVEERVEDAWQSAATVPYDVAVVVAQARAQRRANALVTDHEELRKDASRVVDNQLRRLKDGEESEIFGEPIRTISERPSLQETSNNGMWLETTTIDIGIEEKEIVEELKNGTGTTFSIDFGEEE